MAISTIPDAGITLHGPKAQESDGGSSAILVKLSGAVVQDMQKAARGKENLQFVTGSSPVGQRLLHTLAKY
jgi:hypothetical protein